MEFIETKFCSRSVRINLPREMFQAIWGRCRSWPCVVRG